MALFVALFSFCHTVNAQVWEDFSDKNLNSNPCWTGDTAKFKINSNKTLQLNAESADSVKISFAYTMPADDTVTWEFWTKLSFTPTYNNYTQVTLFDNGTNSLSVSITDPEMIGKIITLYRDGNPVFHFPYSPTLSTNPLRIKVKAIRQQQIELWIDTIGDLQKEDYLNVGSIPAATSLPTGEVRFGIQCKFTSSRAHHFYYDDIGINRPKRENRPLFKGDLLVNEILFNPEPDGSDYVEIYNNCDSAIDIRLVRLAKIDGDEIVKLHSIADTGEIGPHDYLVVTTNAGYVRTHYNVLYPSKMVEVSTMPSYNDDKGTVVIASSDSVILDRFDYTSKMHSALLRDKEGVALERRSTERATQEESNWYSAASTTGYGTPTYKNSQSHEILFVDNDFLIEKTIFSPDGDGYNDLLDVTYQLSNCDLSCNANIYDSQGRQVRRLLRGETLGCEGVLTWDGTDQNGKRCLRGNYMIVLEAYNEKGARQSWRRRITLIIK